MKMIPLVRDPRQGRSGLLTTCNPTTVQDDVVAAGGARRRGLRVAQYERCRLATVMGKAIARQPTHLCEMGADITTLLHQRGEFGNIVAGLKPPARASIGWGYSAGYPIFNWDDLPVKRAAQPPYGRSHRTPSSRPLTSPCMRKSAGDRLRHGRRRRRQSFGGQVMVAEIDPARRLQAAYDGWHVVDLRGYRLGGRGGHSDRR